MHYRCSGVRQVVVLCRRGSAKDCGALIRRGAGCTTVYCRHSPCAEKIAYSIAKAYFYEAHNKKGDYSGKAHFGREVYLAGGDSNGWQPVVWPIREGAAAKTGAACAGKSDRHSRGHAD